MIRAMRRGPFAPADLSEGARGADSLYPAITGGSAARL